MGDEVGPLGQLHEGAFIFLDFIASFEDLANIRHGRWALNLSLIHI